MSENEITDTANDVNIKLLIDELEKTKKQLVEFEQLNLSTRSLTTLKIEIEKKQKELDRAALSQKLDKKELELSLLREINGQLWEIIRNFSKK